MSSLAKQNCKIYTGTAKLKNTITVTSTAQGYEVDIDITSVVPDYNSRYVYPIALTLGVNPAGVTMSAYKAYNKTLGTCILYVAFENTQTINANTDVPIILVTCEV